MEKPQFDLATRCSSLGIGKIKRHIFLCAGEKCCSKEVGETTWEWLKERSRKGDFLENGLFRTKAACLRVCCEGPIVVVYPEGTWYKNVTPDVCERIVEEHLLKGNLVTENLIFKK